MRGVLFFMSLFRFFFFFGDGIFLMGDYIIRVEFGEVVLFGNVYGLLGIDGYGRDLWVGFVWVIWGIIVFVGFVVLFVIVIGLFFGVMLGYYFNVIGDVVRVFVEVFYLILVIFFVLVMIYVVFKVGVYIKFIVLDWFVGIIIVFFFFS